METGARSYGIWNCLHVCTSHQCSKKVRKPNRQFFFFKTGEFAPREKWHQLVGCSGGPNAARKFAGHLLAPPWSLEQDPRALGTAYMRAPVISVQKKSENPTDKFCSFKTGGFAPRENWQQLVGCFGGPNVAQILQVTSLHLHGAWSKSLGHLELPTWVH